MALEYNTYYDTEDKFDHLVETVIESSKPKKEISSTALQSSLIMHLGDDLFKKDQSIGLEEREEPTLLISNDGTNFLTRTLTLTKQHERKVSSVSYCSTQGSDHGGIFIENEVQELKEKVRLLITNKNR